MSTSEWASAGGPDECVHGYARGITCPRCSTYLFKASDGHTRESVTAAGFVPIFDWLHTHSRLTDETLPMQLRAVLERFANQHTGDPNARDVATLCIELQYQIELAAKCGVDVAPAPFIAMLYENGTGIILARDVVDAKPVPAPTPSVVPHCATCAAFIVASDRLAEAMLRGPAHLERERLIELQNLARAVARGEQ